MRIAQRYLDEIEQICEGEDMDHAVSEHWFYPNRYAGLFAKCTLRGACIYSVGCLTQIRFGLGQVIGSGFKPLLHLTEEIKADERLAKDRGEILPKHLRSLTYPLTDSQKQEVRECLYPYAEWQTRLRLEFQDVPGIEAEIVEVGA